VHSQLEGIGARSQVTSAIVHWVANLVPPMAERTVLPRLRSKPRLCRMKKLLPPVLIVISFMVCSLVGLRFVRLVFTGVPPATSCRYQFSTKVLNEYDPDFQDCRKQEATLFIEKDYTEMKDLAKAFLTLVTAVFVASITFSEKIVNFSTAGWWSKGMMITSWVLLLLAIASCGLAVSIAAMGAIGAAHDPSYEFVQFGYRSAYFFISSGLLFGSALVALLVAGIISLVQAGHAVAPSPASSANEPQM
jgi:hypothetical protein